MRRQKQTQGQTKVWIGSAALLIGVTTGVGCASVPWDSIEGLDEGAEYQKILPRSSRPSPQIYSATEGASVSIPQKEARHEARIGDVILEIRGPQCSSCDELESRLKEILPDLRPELRWIRVEAQDAAEAAAFQTDIAPTLILMRQGRELKRALGLRSKRQIRKFIESEFGA